MTLRVGLAGYGLTDYLNAALATVIDKARELNFRE
jgi:hypothetical protein